MNPDNDYYVWLLESIDALHGEHSCYQLLVQHLFTTEYDYAFEMDRNRAMAGENLRALYSQDCGIDIDDVNGGPCNVLEMLIALSKSMAFDTSTETSEWFWKLIDNLGLTSEDDEHFDRAYVDHQLDIWMSREYSADGDGSLFPIPNFDGDLQRMEVWDQKNAYLTTLYPAGKWLD